jgi:hypothetical protein
VADVVAALERAFGPAAIIGASATWVCRAPEARADEVGPHVWVPLHQGPGGVDIWLMPPEQSIEPLPTAIRVEMSEDLDELIRFIRDRRDRPNASCG